MYSEILRFALLCSLLGLLLPSPAAAAQRWNDLEDELEGRELVLRPTFEGRRKVYLDGEDDRVFVLHRGNRLFPLRESETVRITDADPEDDHIELELQSARLGRGRVDFYGPTPSAQDFERWLDEVFEVTTAEADFQRWHCQLVEGSALLPREIDAPDRFQQAHVTTSHSTNARVRSRRW